jgi:hypothetical protein
MARLVFDGRAVARLLRDSRRSANRRPTMAQQVERLAREQGINAAQADLAYGQLPDYEAISAPGPDIPVGLLLVKDSGIYLMSNGDRTGGTPRVKGGLAPVYAEGYEKDREGVYDAAREAMGGDDSIEFLPVERLPREVTTDPTSLVVINVEGDILDVRLELAQAPAQVPARGMR